MTRISGWLARLLLVASVSLPASAVTGVVVTKTADAPSVSAGSTIGFTITGSVPSGSMAASNFTIADILPTGTGITWIIASQSGGWTLSGNIVSWGPATVPSGGSVTVHVTSTTTTASCGTYSNTAFFTTSNYNSGTASASTQVVCSTVTLTKTADAASVSAGSAIGYTITARNLTVTNAVNFSVTDTLPAGSGLSWTIASQTGAWLLAGGVLSFGPTTLNSGDSVTVHVTSPTTSNSCGNYQNTARFTSTNLSSDSASASTQVLCPTITLTKTADAASVNAASAIGYTITASNTGLGDAAGFNITDSLPFNTGVTWSIASQSGGFSLSANDLSYGPTTLPSGGTVTVHVTSPTTFDSCATFFNAAHYTTTAGGSGASTRVSTQVLCPSVTLTKSADAQSVSAGSAIGYTITANNTGAGDATGFSIADTLPTGTGITWSIASQSGGFSLTGNSLSYGPATLASHASVTVHVTSSTTSGSCATYLNTAHYTATNGGSGDSSQASTQVLCPSVALTKTADSASVSAAAAIGYTITASNTGAGDATGFSIADTLPAGTGITWSIASQSGGFSLTGNSLSYGPATLASNASVSVHVTSPTTSGSCATYNNTAHFTATNTGPGDSSQDSTQVLCSSVTLTKTADAASVSAGSAIGYTITATNTGAGDAAGFSIADTLPAGPGITWSIATQSGGFSLTGDSLSYGPATLASNASVTVHVTSPTTSASCGSYPNTAHFTTTNDGSGDSSQVSTQVVCGTVDGIFLIRYASNLTAGDSVVNITNTGANGNSLYGPGFGDPAGNLCVNVYAFSPDEQLISCCSCLVTPNGLVHVTANNDLISNTLTGVRPNSIVIKMVATATGKDSSGNATYNGSSCADSAALAGADFPVAPAGLLAWGTTLHSASSDDLTPTTTGPFSITETPFLPASLNNDELASIRNRCANIVGNGSTFGQCRSCRLGGLGAAKQ